MAHRISAGSKPTLIKGHQEADGTGARVITLRRRLARLLLYE